MKLARSFLFVGVVVVLGAGWLFAQAAQPTTIEGTMVDGRCYMMNPANTGDTHGKTEACGKLCMNSGAPAAVLTSDKQFHPVMTFAGSFADIIGQTVRVTGPVQNGAILARKVEVNKGGEWQEVTLQAMKR